MDITNKIADAIENQIYEHLEIDENVQVLIPASNWVIVKIFDDKIISVKLDDNGFYKMLLSSPRIFITDTTTNCEIEKYHKKIKIFLSIKNKIYYEKIKKSIICNMILLNEKLDNMI